MFWVGAVVSMCFFQLLSANINHFESEPSAPPISRSHPVNPLNNGKLQVHINRNTLFEYNGYTDHYYFAPNEIINAVCFKSHGNLKFEYISQNNYRTKTYGKDKLEFTMLLKPQNNWSYLDCTYQGIQYMERLRIVFSLDPRKEINNIRVDGLFVRANLGNIFKLKYYGDDFNVTCNDKPAALSANKESTSLQPVIDAVCDDDGTKTILQLYKDIPNKGIHVSGLHFNKIYHVALRNWENRILYEFFDGETIQLNCTHNFSPEYWQLDDIFKVDGVNSIPRKSFIFNRRMKKDYHWSTIICGYKYMKTFITFFYVEEKPTKTEQLETKRSDNNDQPGTVKDNYWIYATSAIVAIVLFLLIMTIFLLRRKQLQQRTEVAIVTDSHYENIAESSFKYENLASDKDELKYSEIDFDGHENKFGQTGINKDLKSDIQYAEVFQNRNDFNNKMEKMSKECKYMNENKEIYTNIDQRSLEPIYCEVGEGNNNNRNSIVYI